MIRRGDVVWAELAPRSGSEQQGRRPVIVVSHDGFNRTPTWRSIIVVPISSSAKAVKGPTSIALSAGVGGLSNDSVALCHQITTLDRSKLTGKIGSLNRGDLARVETGIKAALDLI